jgi:hypothetical protein
MSLLLQRAHAQAWEIPDPSGDLAWRASLPGAFGYDQAAHVLRAVQAQGTPAVELLPVAFPTSWMVNAKATSRTFRAWLTPGPFAAWNALLTSLGASTSQEDWLALGPEPRAVVQAAVTELASVEGASLVAVTKVLALLRPQLVPLMDDAALWFAIDAVPEPTSADKPIAAPALFEPMMDWFAQQSLTHEAGLVDVAAAHELAVLDVPQTLDRLLWVASWGHRLRAPKER